MQGKDTHGPLVVMQSAMRVDQDPFQATLLNMKFHPSAYRDLVVRIAGYSAYFVQLNESMQEEVINRTVHTL